ncbi:MAG: DUF4255 domain-containing protein [Gemmatimonadetes bacterium]|nr:DUF4255 domain-containing protein [Gemmatimonadota bacterium]
MSTALGLGAVTAVLRDLLVNGVIDHDLVTSVGDVNVTALPPDRIDVTTPNPTSQLNLFLYSLTPNVGWRNAALPARTLNGHRASADPMVLDLHYLLTAYGARDFHAEILLGYAMQLLHENPILTRDAIRQALAPPSPVTAGGGLPPTLQALSGSELADQFEQIRVTPEPISLDEMSRLWSGMQTHYRLSTAYLATTVLIERRRSYRRGPPVTSRNLVVRATRRAEIHSVSPQLAPAGATLTVRGRNLRADIVRVRFATGPVNIPLVNVTDDQITVTAPAGLLAGVNTIQVEHPVDFGTPTEPHIGFVSNLAAFIVTPDLTSATPIAASIGVPFTVTVSPPIGRNQRVAIVLGDRTVPLPPQPPTAPATSPTLSITLPPETPTGTTLFRVQVDGAETPLVQDPVTGDFTGPLITVT